MAKYGTDPFPITGSGDLNSPCFRYAVPGGGTARKVPATRDRLLGTPPAQVGLNALPAFLPGYIFEYRLRDGKGNADMRDGE